MINGTNVYLVEASGTANNFLEPFFIEEFAACDLGDFVLNGGFDVEGTILKMILMIILITPTFLDGKWGWFTHINARSNAELTLHVEAYCFDNPPAHIP